MSKKNPQTSTRNIKFNKYTDSESFICSTSTITAANSERNIKLLDYNEYIIKSGKDIIDDAKSNTTMKDHKYDIVIDTQNIDENKNDYYIYGSPYKMVLDNHQQYNNCGPDSVLNVLVMAGETTIKNQNKTETEFTKDLWIKGLVDDEGKMEVFDFYDGGTTPASYKEIFEYYGIDSEAYATPKYSSGDTDGKSISLQEIANIVRSGGAAILGVCTNVLWFGEETGTVINHAVSVTGVVYSDKDVDDNTQPIGFYIHDTGGWMSRYISYEDMVKVTLSDRDDIDGKDVLGAIGTVVKDPVKRGTDNINATGNKYDNTIIGNTADNIIKGVGGENILVGNAGDDLIYGGSGNDTIYGNDYSVTGGESYGKNTIYGRKGKDTIYGGNYNDLIYGGSGGDIIHGNDGTDAIYGGDGNDFIYGGKGNDRLVGQAGKDYIEGGLGSDTLIGGADNDTLIGGAGNDRIDCGSGKDLVIYNDGDGADIVTSSSGNVTFQFDKNAFDIDYEMEKNSETSKYGLFTIMYTKTTGIDFEGFYNQKKNSCKTAYLKDSNEDTYRIYATSSKNKISVKNTKGNNILFSLSSKNNTIITSNCNDIVYMIGGDDIITYTGGKDYYTSFSGNDTYTVNSFDDKTNLVIYDCADEENNKDNLKINSSASDIKLFFNITKEGIISDDSDLFVLNKSVSEDVNTYRNIISNGNENGTINILNYFNDGYIEKIQYKPDNNYVDYNTSYYIDRISASVADWFDQYGSDYTDVFSAIQDTQNTHVDDLIFAFTNI